MEDGYALIEVSDPGVGIAAHEQERIFERFYRVPNSDGDTAGGTGLGLTLVQHIAVAHGGHVTVESEPQRGSTFTLYLPLEAHPLEAHPLEAHPLEAQPLEAHSPEAHRT
jgi:two-component system sensor histidine kinase SenX3